ncbi:MAG: choice-of-anchor D domain-containing protein, partial [Chloroflexi bacterium]
VTTDPSSGAQVVSGTVTNLDTVSVSNAQLFFTFYRNATDTPLQTIAEDRLWVNFGNPLAPLSTTPFTLDRLDIAPFWNGAKAALLAEAPTPAVSFSPTQVAVTQVKTTTSAPQLVSLTNIGTADLHLGTLTLGGAHPTEWAETDTCAGATVTPFGSCSISLTFTPAGVGDRSATLDVADDANLTPQSLPLIGTGIDPKAVPSPSPLAFGPQATGTTSAVRSLTVSNPGVGDLQVATVAVSGTNAGDFAMTANSCANATVPQGSSCSVAFTFHPSGLGSRVATLTITDNALDSPQTVSLTGTGVTSAVAFDPPSRAYDFGNEKLATTSAPTSVTIINKGVTTLIVSGACSSDPAEFSVGSAACIPGFSLSPSMSRAIPVTFTPSQTGVRTGTLTFTDNALDSPQTVTLSGKGTFGGQYHPLAPARIYDSRNGAGPLAPGSSRTIPVTGVGQVRADASAVVLNVTVTNTTASSFLTVYPTGVTRPTASNLNWVKGQTVPNLVEVGVGSGGAVDIFNALGSADVIFDVAGYVAPEGDTPGPAGFYTPVVPARVLDTRSGIGASSSPVGAGAQVDVPMTGVGSVPPVGVAAVVLNVTVTNATAPSFLTVFPTGGAPPVISNLNFVAGQTVPNRVIVKVGAGGMVSFYNAAGRVDVIADVAGWFSDATPGGTG